jgi:hypothetical protein
MIEFQRSGREDIRFRQQKFPAGVEPVPVRIKQKSYQSRALLSISLATDSGQSRRRENLLVLLQNHVREEFSKAPDDQEISHPGRIASLAGPFCPDGIIFSGQ